MEQSDTRRIVDPTREHLRGCAHQEWSLISDEDKTTYESGISA